MAAVEAAAAKARNNLRYRHARQQFAAEISWAQGKLTPMPSLHRRHRTERNISRTQAWQRWISQKLGGSVLNM